MKLMCGEKALDLDALNAVKPDGEHAWCEVVPYSYNPERLPESDGGTYMLTSDRGAVHTGDLAFKILFDLGIWCGDRSFSYLAAETARGAACSDGGWSRGPVPEGTAAMEFVRRLDLRGVRLPDCSRTLRCNLAVLDAPCRMDGRLGGFLSDFIYTEGLTLAELHGALAEFLSSLAPAEFARFMESAYGAVMAGPAPEAEPALEAEPAPEAEPVSGAEDGGVPDIPDIPGGEEEDPAEAVPAPEPGSVPEPGAGTGAAGLDAASGVSVIDVRKAPRLPGGSGLFTGGRRLKGSDLTGTDASFMMDYYEGMYRRDLEDADSEGFADQLIRARAGEGPSPVAVLDEAVAKLYRAMASGSRSAGAESLREQLGSLIAEVNRAAGGAGIGIPEKSGEDDGGA